jgi:hypothetical protein
MRLFLSCGMPSMLKRLEARTKEEKIINQKRSIEKAEASM